MVDEIYQNAFKEVNRILENTDEELVKRIPTKFMDFIKSNMNINYVTNIKPEIDIDKQKLLRETESILSLIYRTYWATDEEKNEFLKNDRAEFYEKEERKKEEYAGKNIDEIFQKRKIATENALNNSLMVIEKDGFIKRIFKKILNLLKR